MYRSKNFSSTLISTLHSYNTHTPNTHTHTRTHTHTHTHTCPTGSLVLLPTVSVSLKVTSNFCPFSTQLQCPSPFSRIRLPLPFEDISLWYAVSEPDDCTGVVHWWHVHAWTHAAAGTYTHLARYGVPSVQSARWAMCTRSLLRGGRYNALRICNCKMRLTSSLCARAFPTMLQIPALDRTTSICVWFHSLYSFSSFSFILIRI